MNCTGCANVQVAVRAKGRIDQNRNRRKKLLRAYVSHPQKPLGIVTVLEGEEFEFNFGRARQAEDSNHLPEIAVVGQADYRRQKDLNNHGGREQKKYRPFGVDRACGRSSKAEARGYYRVAARQKNMPDEIAQRNCLTTTHRRLYIESYG